MKPRWDPDTEELDLRSSGLTVVPGEIRDLAKLKGLNLSQNRLRALPEWLGQLGNLTELSLHGNQLSALPESLGQLSNLTRLSLNNNHLSALPESLGQLRNLTQLSLAANRLSALPESLGRLDGLISLWLHGNRLNVLPDSLGQLRNLTHLFLHGNRLSALPESLGQLRNLTQLLLQRNRLSALPESLGQLGSLTQLWLHSNRLGALPASLGQLGNLTELSLQNNQLSALPASLGQLGNLTQLWLHGNRLSTLPESLGQLGNVTTFSLRGNPLPQAILGLAGNPPDLLEYLRGLQAGDQYDAKVLLIGQGGVGKSSLLASMAGEEFDANRDTTHGIEVTPLPSGHPGKDGESLTLNCWDFGGQEIYWITNQLFFSENAIYLLLWRPREGFQHTDLEPLLERVRLRAGKTARVVIVGTHCKGERHGDLDYGRLESKFPDLLAGNFEIDSSDGTGVAELREHVAKLAASLEHLRTPWPERWLPVRRSLLDSGKEQLTYAEYERACAEGGLEPGEARALLRLMAISGLVVHHDSDGLRDFVVLDPEWLTKAISYVLEDRETREAGGYLEHERLGEIWTEHGKPNRTVYSAEHFPYFLRIMEEFDVCYRIPESAQSLVAQMVPYQRPALPWEPDSPRAEGELQLSLTCELSSEPVGLVAWQTVRNHRRATGVHWRGGVLLRHENGHEALLELEGKRLRTTVRGRHPSGFSEVLRDGLAQLIDDRWPQMEYRWLGPCPHQDAGAQCRGTFDLDRLKKALAKGREVWPCDECMEDIEIGRFLLGYFSPKETLEQRVEALLLETTGRIEGRLEELSARSAEVVRQVFRSLADEANHGPRLFTLLRAAQGVGKDRHRLTFWCEHPGTEHPCWKDGGYELELPRKWLRKISPALTVVSKVLRVATPIAAAGAGVALDASAKADLDFTATLAKELLSDRDDARDLDPGEPSRGDTLESNALRALHSLVKEKYPNRYWEPLRRVLDKASGDVLWVCPKHYTVYDQGLPELPRS